VASRIFIDGIELEWSFYGRYHRLIDGYPEPKVSSRWQRVASDFFMDNGCLWWYNRGTDCIIFDRAAKSEILLSHQRRRGLRRGYL
jgi:hypothetical protein